jgi:hypothetical protein
MIQKIGAKISDRRKVTKEDSPPAFHLPFVCQNAAVAEKS